MRLAPLLAAALLLAQAGCSALLGYGTCPDVPASSLALAPATLSRTGLFSDVRRETLAAGVTSFRPRFELSSDGATKRRWIFLPPGSRIDTPDADAWRFPKGTKLWKEFTRDGVRVETRYLEKTGEAAEDWLAVAYVWNDDGDAVLTPEGVADARGTPHDVPPAKQCMGCHGGSPSRVLGFSAMQLSASVLEKLAFEGKLSAPPPKNTVPGNDTEVAALGYLHANCSHCHNTHRPPSAGARCFDPKTSFDLSLRTTDLARVEATGAYRTARYEVIVPGSPVESALFRRVAGSPFEPRMPALGTKNVDGNGVELLRHWIAAMK